MLVYNFLLSSYNSCVVLLFHHLLRKQYVGTVYVFKWLANPKNSFIQLGMSKRWRLSIVVFASVFKSKRSEMDWVVERSGRSHLLDNSDSVIRLRGLPFECTKEDISNFFEGTFLSLSILFHDMQLFRSYHSELFLASSFLEICGSFGGLETLDCKSFARFCFLFNGIIDKFCKF